MIKIFLSILVLFSNLSAISLTSKIEKDLVQSIIPKTNIIKIKHTQIDGLYEAFLKNGEIVYIYPYKRLLFFGKIYTNTGIDLTQIDLNYWKQQVNRNLLKTLNVKELTKDSFTLKFGKGSNRYAIVMFTDPECPFCRRVDRYLRNNNVDATFYINYMPLYFHKNAKKWALQILSSKNKKEAIDTIEKTNKDLDVTITQKAKKTLKNTQDLAQKLNIRGTPTMFVIDTKTNKVIDKIDGANIPKMEQWLKRDSNEK